MHATKTVFSRRLYFRSCPSNRNYGLFHLVLTNLIFRFFCFLKLRLPRDVHCKQCILQVRENEYKYPFVNTQPTDDEKNASTQMRRKCVYANWAQNSKMSCRICVQLKCCYDIVLTKVSKLIFFRLRRSLETMYVMTSSSSFWTTFMYQRIVENLL